MTGTDFDRTLAGWFDAEALSPAPAGGLDRVLDATSRRRPRPAWLAGLGSDWVGEAEAAGRGSGVRVVPRSSLRWLTILILLLAIAALLGGAILAGARLLQPPTSRSGRLAYALGGDIYVADGDGKNPVRIADGNPGPNNGACGSYWAEGPMWSPDGRHLAYRSDLVAPCSPNVYISDPAGHVVASFPVGTGWLVSWSPDSTRVATWFSVSSNIAIYGLDGVRQALLALPSGYGPPGDFDPAWSPDGASLLIELASPSVPSAQVWQIPIDGGAPRIVPAEDPRSHLAAFSLDRTHVAYVTGEVSPESLLVAAADGSQARTLIGGQTPGTLAHPVWSPIGDRIAFIERLNSVYDQAGNPLPGTYELRVVDIASGTVTTASAPITDNVGLIGFSPDGGRILYETIRATTVGETSAWSVHADGTDPQLLVTGPGGGDFDWQPMPAP
jgi:Tol biopolymer transport system component